MKITTISARYTTKANLGDFSSVDVECALWAALDEDDSPTESIRQLFETARTEVNEQLWPLIGHVEASVQRLFGGKPILGNGRK